MAKNHTLSGSKGSRKYTVVLSGSKHLKRVYPFGSIFAENDTRLGSKNGENYTLSSGTYPVPKTSKCPPPRAHPVISTEDILTHCLTPFTLSVTKLLLSFAAKKSSARKLGKKHKHAALTTNQWQPYTVSQKIMPCLCGCCGGAINSIISLFEHLHRLGFNLEFEILYESI